MHTNEDEESQTADESVGDLFWRDRTSGSSVEPHGCTHVVRNKIALVALENLSAYICVNLRLDSVFLSSRQFVSIRG
jgi:hypothetical protein